MQSATTSNNLLRCLEGSPHAFLQNLEAVFEVTNDIFCCRGAELRECVVITLLPLSPRVFILQFD